MTLSQTPEYEAGHSHTCQQHQCWGETNRPQQLAGQPFQPKEGRFRFRILSQGTKINSYRERQQVLLASTCWSISVQTYTYTCMHTQTCTHKHALHMHTKEFHFFSRQDLSNIKIFLIGNFIQIVCDNGEKKQTHGIFLFGLFSSSPLPLIVKKQKLPSLGNSDTQCIKSKHQYIVWGIKSPEL